MNPPLSLVVLTKNESSRLAKCIESAKDIVDEIVIVDDESMDNTVEIAKQYTDKVFVRKMELEGRQRNFAASKISNDWLLYLDADEQLTPALAEEIKRTLPEYADQKVAFWVPFKNYFADQWMRHGGWYPAHKIRIYNKNHITWMEQDWELVHPGLKYCEGLESKQLKEHILHQNFENIEHYISKLNRHTTLEAMKWHLSGKKCGLFHGLWKSFDRFMRRYIGKGGFKDGYYGFVASALSGFYQFAVYSKYREIKHRKMYVKEESA